MSGKPVDECYSSQTFDPILIDENQDRIAAVNFRMFKSFIIASSDAECAKFTSMAAARGANVNANILNTPNLLDCAIKEYKKFKSNFLKWDEELSIMSEEIMDYFSPFKRTEYKSFSFNDKITSYTTGRYIVKKAEDSIGFFCKIIEDIKHCYAPMHIAAFMGLTSTMNVLHANGASIEATAAPGTTPVLLACRAAQTKSIEWLLDHGAHLDKSCAELYKKVVVHTSQNSFELLGWLIERIDDQDSKNHDIFVEAFKNLSPDHELAGISIIGSSADDI